MIREHTKGLNKVELLIKVAKINFVVDTEQLTTKPVGRRSTVLSLPFLVRHPWYDNPAALLLKCCLWNLANDLRFIYKSGLGMQQLRFCIRRAPETHLNVKLESHAFLWPRQQNALRNRKCK